MLRIRSFIRRANLLVRKPLRVLGRVDESVLRQLAEQSGYRTEADLAGLIVAMSEKVSSYTANFNWASALRSIILISKRLRVAVNRRHRTVSTTPPAVALYELFSRV